MNIFSTTILAGAFAVLPGLPSLNLAEIALNSPFEELTICAAGIGVDVNGKGVEAHLVETNDFVIELSLKSGAPIRVRL